MIFNCTTVAHAVSSGGSRAEIFLKPRHEVILYPRGRSAVIDKVV
jgi:hypothetical protein